MLDLPFYLPGWSFLQKTLSDCPHRSTGQRSAPAGPQPLLPTSAAAGVQLVQLARCVADRQPLAGLRNPGDALLPKGIAPPALPTLPSSPACI